MENKDLPNSEELSKILESMPVSEESEEKNGRSVFKIMLGVFLTIVIIGVVWILFVKPEDSATPSSNNTVDKSNAYFIPPTERSREKSLKGKIKNTDPMYVNGKEIAYILVDNNEEKIAYLYSTSNDLNLSVGFNVEVLGVAERKQYNDMDIINVKTIKLK